MLVPSWNPCRVKRTGVGGGVRSVSNKRYREGFMEKVAFLLDLEFCHLEGRGLPGKKITSVSRKKHVV